MRRLSSASRLLRAPLVILLSSGLILATATAQDHQRAPVPGAVDAHVTQATIHTTICHRGYTATVRPSRAFTEAIKRRLADGLPGRNSRMRGIVPPPWRA